MTDPSWYSILPPILAIVLAIWSKQVILSLFAGIWMGYTILNGFHPLVGVTAVVLHLRRRGACSIDGALRYRRMLAVLVGTALATYVGLFWFTKYLGIWFGDS